MGWKDTLLALFKKPEVQSGLSVAMAGTALPAPALSAILSVIKEGVGFIDQIRLSSILHGLASGLNQETMLNELTNYISESEDNAYHVANTLRKAMYAESRKGCVLLGRILADHIGKNERYNRDDLIIVHAIETVTDEDLLSFRKMMERYCGEDIEIIDQITVDWCYSNRIFGQRLGKVRGGTLMFTPRYVPEKAAYKLMNYLDEIKQFFS